MPAVAEKLTRTAPVARRAPVRPPLALWSAASASEQRALRAIVAERGPAPAQRAIEVGPANDEYEREADAMADEVMRAPAPAPEPAAQRACAGCEDELQRSELEPEEEEEERVQRESEAPTFADPGDEEEEQPGLRRLLAPRPQRAIEVGPADDEYEREADAMADAVMRAEAAPAPVEEDEEEAVQSKRRQGVGPEGGEIEDAELTARLRFPGSGRPLPAGTRALIEPRLGYDFSRVRVHDSAEDRRDAARLSARAFTYGRHIWIGPGESADNPRLMAHELTHVVQQGAATPVVRRQDEDDESWLDSAMGAIADTGWGLVRMVAPGLEANLRPLIERGPLNWLKDRLASVFDSLAGGLNALNPAGALDTLMALFDELVARAEPILAALRTGDCEPLFQAIDELKTFVTDIATSAWDKLVEFVSPVGEFFTDLWSGYGAPAIEWLQNFAGDVWEAIRQLGADIWDWTRPVRDAVTGAFSSAWGWVKEQLFGPEDAASGDSEGGLVAWIQGKAAEAWDWFKDQTRPVWQPVVALAEEINALIPPPFVRRLGEQFSQLGTSLNRVNEQASGGDDVAANREALAAALPTLEEVIEGVRGVIVSAGGWLEEKVGLVSGAFSGLLARLRGHALLAPLGGALSWLDGAAQSLGRWARGQVRQLFGMLLSAFNFLAPFVRRLVAMVQDLIAVVGDLMQLPQMVLSTVWNLIPACIRDPVKDFIINQILRRIPVFSTLLELPDIWARVEATALRILRQVFVDGDLARAAWTYFSAILEILGIPPQLVVSILAKAATAIGDILANPVGFLLNLLSAIKEGFIRFFGNIGTHLLGGVTGWLFGQLSAGGLRPPADFSLGSILGFVLQVLDITVDRVFERLARRLDPAIVQRLRQALEIATGVWRFVAILIEEGPAGLWREIQEQLAGLWDRVLDGVIGWLTRTIITRVSARLLTMLDPSGVMAAVNSAIALYRAIQSALEYVREMLQIVDRVLDGIGGIARGAIDIAAGFFEAALAGGIPVAIGFLANQIGLRNFGERIQEMVESVREMVDRAIDWVIDRAIAGGQALINLLRRGVAAVRNWWAARKEFTPEGGGESHALYFEGSGPGARLMIASEPQTYQSFLRSVEVPADKQTAKNQALTLAGELDRAIARAGAAAPAGATGAPAAGGAAAAADPAAEISDLLDRLATVTAQFMPRAAGAATPPEYGSLRNEFGTSVRVERLTKAPGASRITGGQPAGRVSSLDAWTTLVRRRPPSGGGSYYVRGHLLNEHLGGPAQWTNLTPITQEANNRGAGSMLHAFENHVKNKVLIENKAVYFSVTAQYGRSHPRLADLGNPPPNASARDRTIAQIVRIEADIPTRVECAAYELANGQRAASPFKAVSVENEIDTSSYDLRS
jgi:hypothetical protein